MKHITREFLRKLQATRFMIGLECMLGEIYGKAPVSSSKA